jgi:RES domain-containing protein
MAGRREARDVELLDLVDRLPREPFAGEAWRVTREGRDPLEPSRARGRWSDGSFDVLYTSLERSGAVAEIFALLSAQPVFPSRIRWRVHRLSVRVTASLQVADMAALEALGIAAADYRERQYERCQAIAEAANFLGFDGLAAPSARWNCPNLVLFMDQSPAPHVAVVESDRDPIDWTTWRDPPEPR